MVFENLSEKYFDNEYFDKYKYDESMKKVSVHLRLPPELANDLVTVIAVYRKFGIDKSELIKSELAAVILNDFFDALSDDESALLDLFAKIKAYNDDGGA